jgi:hypothetical protein
MTQSLFALTGAALALQRQVEEAAAGLVDPATQAEALAALEALLAAEDHTAEALADKADAYCWVIDEIRARAAARKGHAARLRELAAADEQHAQILQDRLIECLLKVSPVAMVWNLPRHRLASRLSTITQVDCRPEELPEQFQRVTTTVAPDKDAIKAALKAGETIPGAALIQRRTWSIK